MFKKVNLQLFASKKEEIEKEETETEETEKEDKKKNVSRETNSKDDLSIKDALNQILKLVTPKEVEQKETVNVPTPKPIKLNPEDEKEVEEQQKGESSWQKIWKAMWR